MGGMRITNTRTEEIKGSWGDVYSLHTMFENIIQNFPHNGNVEDTKGEILARKLTKKKKKKRLQGECHHYCQSCLQPEEE
ncbi:hypothetical protein E2C01_029229 [Portunus trituberculatus]|uniref:Uncharacterized protein n=1 Tax=Portunus trituberculatus TaxID=210409 RepID=A0A5B7ESA2_PORTR|nr:hypothetical protein [Portunus trituberculatus]